MYRKDDPMVVVNFRLPEDVLEYAVMRAMQRGITLSEWMREAIENALKTKDSK